MFLTAVEAYYANPETLPSLYKRKWKNILPHCGPKSRQKTMKLEPSIYAAAKDMFTAFPWRHVLVRENNNLSSIYQSPYLRSTFKFWNIKIHFVDNTKNGFLFLHLTRIF